MKFLTDQIRGAYDAGFPYAALMLAFSAPDVCANLALPPEANDGHQQKRYKRWYEANLASKTRLSADDVWSLRCGVVHNGHLGNKHQPFDKVVFHFADRGSVDLPFGFSIAGEPVSTDPARRIVGLSAREFCETVIAAVEEWFEKMKNDPNVQNNLPRLVREYPDGFEISPGVTILSGTRCIA